MKNKYHRQVIQDFRMPNSHREDIFNSCGGPDPEKVIEWGGCVVTVCNEKAWKMYCAMARLQDAVGDRLMHHDDYERRKAFKDLDKGDWQAQARARSAEVF